MPKANLLSSKLEFSRQFLLQTCQLLDYHNIPYFLEGGTLLGLVRDGDLLPWDGDLDISINFNDAERFEKLQWHFFRAGKKVSKRRSTIESGPISLGQRSLYKIKPFRDYILKAFNPKHDIIVLDVFAKVSDAHHTYWQANGKVMRVENIHYNSFETIQFRGMALKVPFQPERYLEKKYGDWRVPVKEWNCAINELTIVR